MNRFSTPKICLNFLTLLVIATIALLLLLPLLNAYSPVAAAQSPTSTPKTGSGSAKQTAGATIPLATPTKTPVSIPPPRIFKAPPVLGALAALAVDADTGKVLYAREPYKHLPQASTTKIMTALTLFAIPDVNLNDFTVAVKDDLVGEANMGLQPGSRLKIIDLLYGLLLDSANDAAMTLARYGGTKLPGSGDPINKFVAEMNREALRLGLWNTHFRNPHGLDEDGHYTSAEDLAIAGWYALRNPIIAGIVKQNYTQLDGYWFSNISNFIRRYAGATGIKPGQTDNAGLCLVASATRYGHHAIIVLLNSPEMQTESDLLMDYAFSQLVAQDQTQKLGLINNFFPQLTSDIGYIGLPDADDRLEATTGNAVQAIVHGVTETAQNVALTLITTITNIIPLITPANQT